MIINSFLNANDDNNVEKVEELHKALREICFDGEITDAISLCLIVAMQLSDIVYKEFHSHKCETSVGLYKCFIQNGEELKKLYDALPNTEKGFRH